MYERFAAGDIPEVCRLPTGVGKTAVIPIWLIALAAVPEKVPRRLVYVVNRRTVVDQATDEASLLCDRLKDTPERPAILAELAQRLAPHAAPDVAPLAISTLRGQFADNGDWCRDPSRPAIVVGTVDMIGSRLLFSGYGIGFRRRPLHAGLLGQDTLVVHDEAHLEPAFQDLLTAIQREQTDGRTRDGWPLKIMELTATSRDEGTPFRLIDGEAHPPPEVPSPPRRPIEVVWRRLTAKKALVLTPEPSDKQIAARIVDLALAHKDSGAAVLIFARTIEAVQEIHRRLTGKGKVAQESVQLLTGTIRGLERDRLARVDPVFARFYRKSPAPPRPGTVYLIATSAGEVGVDLSADHLVCDLTPWDSMAQRLGRVNRFGDRSDTRIDVVHPAEFGKQGKGGQSSDDDFDAARQKTLALLETLEGDASPRALESLDAEACRAAFTPRPISPDVTDIHFDAWALTTIAPPLVRTALPGRPPVDAFLHGISDWQRPETYVAWREEVQVITGSLLECYAPEEHLADYPLKPHELLRDSTDRKGSGVFAWLKGLAARHPDEPVWLVDPRGRVTPTTLRALADGESEVLYDATLLMPPSVGGLNRNGFLDSRQDCEKPLLYDVADEWFDDNAQSIRRRIRVRGDDPQFDDKTRGMRPVRPPIDTAPDADEEDSPTPGGHRLWCWYTLPRAADDEGSKTSVRSKPIALDNHLGDVAVTVARIVATLDLPPDIQQALTLAARFHDLGKQRKVWQRSIGNFDPHQCLAKPGRKMKPLELNGYRHEFGSLLDVRAVLEFQHASDDVKDLVLHLIAAHHGRGRPHFPADEVFDPEPSGNDAAAMVAEVPRRFARLQRKYGRWGLAYLESLLRAADYAVSADPTITAEDES
jgi:CRISPR-associated endonuclease/helicase Cas3